MGLTFQYNYLGYSDDYLRLYRILDDDDLELYEEFDFEFESKSINTPYNKVYAVFTYNEGTEAAFRATVKSNKSRIIYNDYIRLYTIYWYNVIIISSSTNISSGFSRNSEEKKYFFCTSSSDIVSITCIDHDNAAGSR